MKYYLLLLLYTNLLFSDFTITYRINNKIIQTNYYKDNNHTLFKFKEGNKTLQELIIVDDKKYIKFKEEDGSNKIYEIPTKESSSNISKPKKIDYKILQIQESGGYNFKTQEWLVQKDDKNETIIVSKDKKIYPKIKKMAASLARLLPNNQEREASIFDMGNGYALIKSKDIELLSHNSDPIDNSYFKIATKSRLEAFSQNIDRCTMHICCGSTKKLEPSKELTNIISSKDSNWKVLNVAKCNPNKESAVLTDGDNYIVIDLNYNKLGTIDSLINKGVALVDIETKRVNGYLKKSIYMPSIDTTIEDIELPSKVISIYTKGKIDLENLSKKIIYKNLY